MSRFHDEQRNRGHVSILGDGGFLVQMPTDLQLALYEDDNVYHIEITDTFPGPAVHFFVGCWRANYYPCISYDRALDRARLL